MPENKAAINREHKSTLFALVFSDAKDALSLYNAMNGTAYDDPGELEFNTLENAVYMGMKNDVSFLCRADMNLYEAQSTWNPNMPLRGVFYLSSLYKAYVAAHGLDIYSSARLTLPSPRYVVFYNGTKEQPDRQELRLSDSFADSGERARDAGTDAESRAGSAGQGIAAAGRYAPALECIAHVVNINHGHNWELMENCRRLSEYARLVEAIRRYRMEGMTLRAAVDRAIDECIADGILADILLKNRAEVTDMILEEYDEELHIQNEKRLSREEGLAEGHEIGLAEGHEIGLAEGRIDAAVKFLSDGTLSPDKIAQILELPPETVRKLQKE